MIALWVGLGVLAAGVVLVMTVRLAWYLLGRVFFGRSRAWWDR